MSNRPNCWCFGLIETQFPPRPAHWSRCRDLKGGENPEEILSSDERRAEDEWVGMWVWLLLGCVKRFARLALSLLSLFFFSFSLLSNVLKKWKMKFFFFWILPLSLSFSPYAIEIFRPSQHRVLKRFSHRVCREILDIFIRYNPLGALKFLGYSLETTKKILPHLAQNSNVPTEEQTQTN